MRKSGIDYINSKPELVRQWINQEIEINETYYAKHPDALTLKFENELRELGFKFEVLSQTKQFLPKHKDTILPIAIRYYQQAKKGEKDFFLSFFHFRGFEETVPMLLKDFYAPNTPSLTREFIAENLRVIRSKKYISDYIKIISNPEYGTGILPIMDLLGKLKVDEAIPSIIELLEDEKIRSNALCALGHYKREELRPYFKRFENDKNFYWRKYARAALKKLN